MTRARQRTAPENQGEKKELRFDCKPPSRRAEDRVYHMDPSNIQFDHFPKAGPKAELRASPATAYYRCHSVGKGTELVAQIDNHHVETH